MSAMVPMAARIPELLQLSRDLGREDHDLAILGEGNTSRRWDSKTFLVKASGAQLATLHEKQLVVCRFAGLLPLLDSDELSDEEVEQALMAARADSTQARPSVEALVHAYLLSLPGVEFVGHTHPVTVNQILCANDTLTLRFAHERRFPDEVVCCGTKSVWIPYIDPGVKLAQGIRKQVDAFVQTEGRVPQVILLQNHGLIACGSTPGSVLAATMMAEKAARIFTGALALGGVTALSPKDVARINSRGDEHHRQRMLKL